VKLARKIILMMMAAFIGLLVTLGYFDVQRATHEYQALVASELELTGHALRAPLAEVLAVDGPARAQQIFSQADTAIARSAIHWVPPAAMTETLAAHRGAVALAAALARGEDVTTDDPGRLYVYVPVGAGGGAIELSQSLDREHAVLVRIVENRLLLAALVFLVALLLSTLAGVRFVGTPMRKLTAHARSIGTGDLSHRLSITSNDEIGELATEMNRTCDHLMKAQDRLADETSAKLKALEQLRHADRLSTVGSLASGMAHELGTPLAVIGGRAKMIATGQASRGECVQYAQIIGDQVRRMTRIMRGMLDFARRTPPRKRLTDLRVPARHALDLLEPLAATHSIELKLAEDAEVAFAEVDALQVEQTIANLVVNAVQATEDHGGAVVVDVRTVETHPRDADGTGTFVRVTVTDAGHGIAEADVPRLFDPFFTTKEVGSGTGLGLAVTYGIVQEHGGFVDVASEAGKGSRFSLYFPA
jgi:two-component system NtrC family sensor kinase